MSGASTRGTYVSTATGQYDRGGEIRRGAFVKPKPAAVDQGPPIVEAPPLVAPAEYSAGAVGYVGAGASENSMLGTAQRSAVKRRSASRDLLG